MKKLNTFSDNNLKFGDYILFQKYRQDIHNGECYNFKISKPIMAIYLGSFIADQTIGFNFVRWNNDRHSIWVTNKYVTNLRATKEVNYIENHIEWNDYIDILGLWHNKPNWRGILASYRKQNTCTIITEYEIDWQ